MLNYGLWGEIYGRFLPLIYFVSVKFFESAENFFTKKFFAYISQKNRNYNKKQKTKLAVSCFFIISF